MGSKDEYTKPKKQLNSYSLLQMKMNEIQKSKKSNQIHTSTSKKQQNSSSTSKPSYSSRTTSNKILKKSPERGKESTSDKKKINNDPNVPDRSYGDYFCFICDSHMNSDAMWEAHITGKRHLKNIKKGDPDPRYEDLNVESSVKYEIRNVKDPIVGLSYIHEIRRKETGAPPLYTCFLCKTTFATVPMIVEHAISMKHQLNYMKENSPDDFELIGSINLKKAHLEPLVHEIALKLEHKFGRGSVKVKQERVKQHSFSFSKRAYDSEEDEEDVHRKLPKILKNEEKKNPYVWKNVDYPERCSFKENVKHSRETIKDRKKSVYSSDEEVDTFKRYDYLRQSSYDSRSSKYGSSTPPPRDSVKKESFYSRTSSHTLPKEHFSQSSSIEKHEKASQSETNVEKSDSNSVVLKDFVQKVYSLPTEIFLKIVLLKLDNMELKGIDELSLLSKTINKAQAVLCNKLPPDVQALLKQKKTPNSEVSVQKSSTMSSVMPQVLESTSFNTATNFKPSNSQGTLQGTDFSFIREIVNQVKGNVDSSLSIDQNTAPHQTAYQRSMALQNSSYGNLSSSYQNDNTTSSNISSYNNAPSSTTGIPGLTLTEENIHPQSSLNIYQTHYHEPSPSYPTYRY